MRTGVIQRSYNINHYYSQRSSNIKIKKCDMYSMLDNPERLKEKLTEKIIADTESLRQSEVFLDREFGL